MNPTINCVRTCLFKIFAENGWLSCAPQRSAASQLAILVKTDNGILTAWEQLICCGDFSVSIKDRMKYRRFVREA
jgi:hypothetical protein